MRTLILCVLLLAGCTPGIEILSPMPAPTPILTPWPPLRDANVGPVVSDIESHLPAGHPYRDTDRITWVHEGTHGVNSYLRNRFNQPGFYVLQNRAVLLREPATTLAAVAQLVPPTLRGEVYNLYLVQMRNYWNEQPSYVFDEWTAYTNGSEARRQLGIRERGETVEYMLEFCIYALCVPYAGHYAGHSTDPQLKAFIGWQTERALAISQRPDALSRLRVAPDAASLRAFVRDYLGPEWTRKTLGF